MLEALAKDALVNLRASCQASRQSSLPAWHRRGSDIRGVTAGRVASLDMGVLSPRGHWHEAGLLVGGRQGTAGARALTTCPGQVLGAPAPGWAGGARSPHIPLVR